MPLNLLVRSIFCFVPLYFHDLINTSCDLSPRWGFGECVFGIAIHLSPRWG